MNKMVFAIAAAALSTAAVFAAPAAFAAESKLSWKDLDLSTPAGQTELDRRLDAAATRMCTSTVETGTIIRHAPSAQCRSAAKSQLAEQVKRMSERTGLGG